MKKLIFGLTAIVIVITGIFTFAGCEKEESAISENIVLLSKANGFQNNYFDFSNYEFYTSNEFGIIHNELLNYTTTHIDINLDFSTIEDLVEYTKNLTQQFVDNYSFLEEDGAAGKTGQLVCKAAEKAGGTVINGISKFISKF